MTDANPFREHGAAWIWPACLIDRHAAPPAPSKEWTFKRLPGRQVNQYVELRHEIELAEAPAGGELTIVVDSNYVAWVNGRFVGTGQFSNYPDRRTYDVLPIEPGVLKKGRNVLALLVRYSGEGCQAYIPGEPGLAYVLRCGKGVFVSGPVEGAGGARRAAGILSASGEGVSSATRGATWRLSPCYRRGETFKITRQLGWSWEYDARGEDGWRDADYAPGPEWAAVAAADVADESAFGTPIPRPIERQRLGGRTAAVVVAQGVFRRCPPSGSAGQPLAWQMQRDFLSAREAGELFGGDPYRPRPLDGPPLTLQPVGREGDGAYLVIDLLREEVGVLELDLEANAGAVVDISYGEHLIDLRVRSETGGRNYAVRYHCRQGRQQYTHWLDRWADRYVQLHVHGLGEAFTLHYAGLRVMEYPLERRGGFRSPDSLANRIYDVGVRTLQLCTHDRYEDCPGREQAMYENDSRNQALCGYYCFGEYRFPRAALDLLGRGWHEDGFLEMTAPSNLARTIPAFSMAWILALEDYHLHTGDAAFIASQRPVADKMLAGWLAAREGGLMPAPKGPRFWHFYDWASGLDGHEDFPRKSWILNTDRFDAPLNLYLVLALEAAAGLAGACGDAERAGAYRAAAAEVRRAVHERFFVAPRDAYKTYSPEAGQAHFCELTQALAVLAGAAPPDLAGRLRERLATGRHDWVVATLSQSIYKFLAVLGERHRHGQAVFDRIQRDWGAMLYQGATSFWEVLDGGIGGYSLCHGWSAVPVYFYPAYLLGVQPAKPGFAEFTVDPVLSVAPCAEGRVPTPHGPIDLRWERAGDHVIYELKHPKGTKPIFPSIRKNDVVKVVQA